MGQIVLVVRELPLRHLSNTPPCMSPRRLLCHMTCHRPRFKHLAMAIHTCIHTHNQLPLRRITSLPTITMHHTLTHILRPHFRTPILAVLLVRLTFTHLNNHLNTNTMGFMFLTHGIRPLLLTLLLSIGPSPPPALPSLLLLPSIRLTRHLSHLMDPTRCLIILLPQCILCRRPRLPFRTNRITLLITTVHTTRTLPATRFPGLSVNSLPRWDLSPEVLHLLGARGVTVLE